MEGELHGNCVELCRVQTKCWMDSSSAQSTLHNVETPWDFWWVGCCALTRHLCKSGRSTAVLTRQWKFYISFLQFLTWLLMCFPLTHLILFSVLSWAKLYVNMVLLVTLSLFGLCQNNFLNNATTQSTCTNYPERYVLKLLWESFALFTSWRSVSVLILKTVYISGFNKYVNQVHISLGMQMSLMRKDNKLQNKQTKE